MDTTLADPLVGQLLDGRYRVECRIARGGMATVYLGRDTRLDRTVALKVMHSSLAEDMDFVRRFIDEAKSAARLSHPNVVSVYDQGADQGTVYLAMECVSGRTLRDLLAERGRLSPSEALEIMIPVLAALGAAHQAGLVHRDVKPENVLITDDGRVKVVDFGLARAVEETHRHTQTGQLIGTVAYLSPEQVSRGVTDARSDVYAAGIMLYELLTGDQPHTGDTPIAVAYKHVHDIVPAPSSRVPGIPVELDTLVALTTSRDPALRPADAMQMLVAAVDAHKGLSGTLALRGGAVDGAAPSIDSATQVLGRGSNETLMVPRQPGTVSAEPARRSRNKLLRVGAAMLAATLLAGVAWAGWWFTSGRYVRVPTFTGVSVADAQSRLKQLGLRVKEGKSEYSEKIAKGMVLRTEPPTPAKLLKGSVVTIVPSAGRKIGIPDVAGKTENQARAMLSEAGLAVRKVERKSNPTARVGTVLATEPPAGTKVPEGYKVTVVVSSGIKIPDLTGWLRELAEDRLRKLGLNSHIIERDDKRPKGEVITQDPAPGTGVDPGSTVTLTVSRGDPDGLLPWDDDDEDMVPVPDVRGKNWREAVRILREAGFRVWSQDFFKGNRVVAQSPTGEAPRGSRVRIWH